MKKRLTKMDFWVLAVLLALIAGVFVRSRMTVAMPDTMTFSYQMELSDVEGTIAPGDVVFCVAGKQPVGTVTDVDGSRLTLQAEEHGGKHHDAGRYGGQNAIVFHRSGSFRQESGGGGTALSQAPSSGTPKGRAIFPRGGGGILTAECPAASA